MSGLQRTITVSRKGDRTAVLIVLLLLIGGSWAQAQLPSATVLGVVRDATGAVVPDATLTARNIATGQTRTAISAPDGSYRFSALPVGTYEIRAEHPGFQTELRSGLTLTVSQEAVVNFALQVGTVEQTVEVTAEAPLVNTTSGSLGGLVSEQRVAELPLNGRNFIDLTLLQPGITQQKNNAPGSSVSNGVWYSSNGAPVRSNNYLLDGAIMQTGSNVTSSSAAGNTLGVEGIREFRVVTNAFSAEYGMTMGSQVLIVSKSGTNELHGSLFEYLRSSALDARNFFDYKTTASNRRLPAFSRNQFGGSAGGPIKKDKTFVYGVYEGLRQRLGVTIVDNVMAAGCHGGAGARITNTACPQLGTIPSVTIAPQMAPLLALFPEPNLPGSRFTYPFTQPTSDNYGQVRVDQAFSSNDTLFARFTIEDTQETNPLAYPQFTMARFSRSQFATLSENHVFSPTLLNMARFSFSRTFPGADSPSDLIGPQYSFVPGRPIGNITIGGVTTLGPVSSANPSSQKQNIFTWSNDLFYTRGRHSLKFGGLINRYQDYFTASTNNRGTINFANTASFLLGQTTTYTALTPGSIWGRTYHFNILGFYAQDDFRVSPRVTLNLGLRYEFMTRLREVHGIGSALRDVRLDATATVGPLFAHILSPRNFSPRFGFAWDIAGDGKTAIRGGFAELYDVGNWGQSLQIGITGTPPFASNSSIRNSTTDPATLTLPLFFPASAAGKSLRTLDYNMQQPHLLSYNLTIERQLPARIALMLAYAGSRGINIAQTGEGNPTVPQILPDGRQFWTGTESRINRNWSGIEFRTASGDSWYNALQFSLVKQLGHGLQFQSAYTWSKLIDTTQGQTTGDSFYSSVIGSDPNHRQVDRGVADFDVTQNWRFNAIYQMPQLLTAGALGQVLNGWRLSGILTLQSGLPFTPALGSNRSRSNVLDGSAGIDRPNLVAGRTRSDIILGAPTRYFDPSAFALQDAGFLGTAGRTIVRGPGLANLDFSIAKEIPIETLGESSEIEFRVEAFNLLNRVNFGMPNRTVFSGTGATAAVVLPTAGVITNTSTPSRQVQFGLRLVF